VAFRQDFFGDFQLAIVPDFLIKAANYISVVDGHMNGLPVAQFAVGRNEPCPRRLIWNQTSADSGREYSQTSEVSIKRNHQHRQFASNWRRGTAYIAAYDIVV
jgi:hypothetical protein